MRQMAAPEARSHAPLGRPMTLRLLGLILLPVVSGCISHTTFRPWDGTDEFVGEGGAYEHRDGIDVYTSGWPARRFRILGVADSSVLSSGTAVALGGSWWSTSMLVNEAKKQSGDAIVLVAAGQQIISQSSHTTYDPYSGYAHTRYGSTALGS